MYKVFMNEYEIGLIKWILEFQIWLSENFVYENMTQLSAVWLLQMAWIPLNNESAPGGKVSLETW